MGGLVRDAKRVGTNRQMGAVFLDHSYRQDEQRPLTIEGVNLWPGELFELVDVRTSGTRAVVPSLCLISR
jgi:hypothetical protein